MFLRHIWKLVFRMLLLAAALCIYFTNIGMLDYTVFFDMRLNGLFLFIVWAALVVDMMYRIFPNKRIAIGARKHFKCSYNGAYAPKKKRTKHNSAQKKLKIGALLSALSWLIINTIVLSILRLTGMLSPAEIMLFVMIYSVLDLIFILFFCPFQKLFMRNRCCTVCRIYNWDYFMICAPMIIFPSFYSISLVIMSFAVLLRWEIAIGVKPHYFLRETNRNLQCKFCKDKLCLIKEKV